MKRIKYLLLAFIVAVVLTVALVVPASAAAGMGYNLSNLNGVKTTEPGMFKWNAGVKETESASYVKTTGGETEFSYNLLSKSGTQLVIGLGETVKIDVKVSLGNVQIQNGTLIISADCSFADGTRILGSYDPYSALENYSTNEPIIQGAFSSISGTGAVKLSPGIETTLYGGSPVINGNRGMLTVKNATPNLSGIFAQLTITAGDVVVTSNTLIEKAVTFDGTSGTVKVSAGKFFAAGDNSVCPAADTSYVKGEWGKLSAGTYNAISGNWTLADNGVTILDTKKLSVGDDDKLETKEDTVNITPDSKDLTVSGGEVFLCANKNEEDTILGTLVINGSTALVHTPSYSDRTQNGTFVSAQKINISGEGKLQIALGVVVRIVKTTEEGKTLYPMIVQPVDGKEVQGKGFTSAILTTWGELASSPATQQYALRGEWILPEGVTGYIGGYETASQEELGDIEKMATVNGHGGSLTLTDVNVAAKGFFAKVKNAGNFLAVPIGSTLATDGRSIRPCYNPEGETGSDVDKKFVKIVNMLVLPSHPVPTDGADLEKWEKMSLEEQAASAYRYADLSGEWTIKKGHYVALESTEFTYELDGQIKYQSDSVKFKVNDDKSTPEDSKAIVYTYTDAQQQEAADINIDKSTASQTDLLIKTAPSTVIHGNRYELDAKGKTYIDGVFMNITGEVYLIGETTVFSTTNHDENGKALIHGEGQILTIKGGNIEVEGEFDTLIDATGADEHRFEDHDVAQKEGGIHIAMTQNLILKSGICGLIGENPDASLTVRGTAFVHAQGVFKQITVKENGTLVDCGGVSVKNRENSALIVEDKGTVIFDHNNTSFGSESETIPVNTVTVSGGSCAFLSGSISANAGSAKAVNVTGGVFTLGYDRDISGLDEDYRAYMKTAQAQSASEFYGAYSDETKIGGHAMPRVSVDGAQSQGIYAIKGGEVFVRAGEIFFEQSNSTGVCAGKEGIVHIYPNDIDGRDDVTLDYLIYIHGGLNSERAMNVENGASFDIRGRGALLEEPRTSSETMPYALFVNENAKIGDRKPLGGGTFKGKVVYDKHNVYELLDYNCYVRYDGTESANFDATDGTYGMHPSFNSEQAELAGTTPANDEKTNPEKLGCRLNMHADEEAFTPDGYNYYGVGRMDYYGEDKVINCFGRSTKGHPAQYYSVADAEWELRRNMADEGKSYQIPAGLGCDLTTVYLDGNSYENSGWAASIKGDVDVLGKGHTINLAGRKISFTGKTRVDGKPLADEFGKESAKLGKDLAYRGEAETGAKFPEIADSKTDFAIHVNYDSELTVRDGIFGKDGTSLTEDDCNGGFVGTGAILYSSFEDNKRDTGVITTDGDLNIVSGQFLADGAGFRANGIRCTDGTTNIGGFLNNVADTEAQEPSIANENNSNKTIVIRGGSDEGYQQSGDSAKIRSKNIYVLPAKMGAESLATVNIYGGTIGALETEGSTAAVLNNAGTVNVYGGILTGDGTYGEGLIANTNNSVYYVNGGCIYSDYGEDDIQNAYGSIDLRKGIVYLNIDAAHSANGYENAAKGYITGKVPELESANVHHLDNVKVSGGELFIGSDESLEKSKDYSGVTGYTHINGNLECSGGKTVIYDTIVAGDTIVTGAVETPFGTQFYVRDGDFGALYIKDHPAVMGPYDYKTSDNTGFEHYVGIHGGSYALISIEDLHTNPQIKSAQEIIGFLSKDYDFDDSAATVNWVGFNHYASEEKTLTRDVNHQWSAVLPNAADKNRAISGAKLVPTEGGAIVVRDAADEFIKWATSVDGGELKESYALPVSILLGEDNKVCNTYFYCTDGRTLPVSIAGGTHKLDTNNYAIAGTTNGAMLVATAGTFEIANTNEETEIECQANQIRNFATTGTDIAALSVSGGASSKVDSENAKPVIFRARDIAVNVAAEGEFELKGANAIGDKTAGIKTAGKTVVENAGNVSSASGNGITATAGTVDVKTNALIKGKLCGIEAQNDASVTVSAENEKLSSIVGEVNDGIRTASGKVTADYATVKGNEYGIQSKSEVVLGNCTVTGGKTGIYADADVTVSGKSTVTGQSYDGISSLGSVTLKGDDKNNTVTVNGNPQSGIRAKALDASFASITGNASGVEVENGIKLKNSTVLSVNPNSAQGGVLVSAAVGESEIESSKITVTNIPGASIPALKFVGKTGEETNAKLTVDGTLDDGAQVTQFGEENRAEYVEISNTDLVWKNGEAFGTVTVTGGETEISGGVFDKKATVSGDKITVSGGKFCDEANISSEKIEVSGGEFASNATLSGNDATLSGGTFAAKLAPTFETFAINGGSFNGGFDLTGGKATVTGGTFAQTFTQNGGELTVKSEKDVAAPVFATFEKIGGRATLLAGIYNKICTNDVNLSANITGSAKDSTEKPVSMTKYVLDNYTTLEAKEYDTDGKGTNVTYIAPFVLSSTETRRPSTGGGGGGGGTPSYSVTVLSGIENGSLTVNKSRGYAGTEIEITAYPNTDCKVSGITVTDAKNNKIAVKDLGSNKYSFIMPSLNVTVSATFIKEEKPVEPVIPAEPTEILPEKVFSDVKRGEYYYDAVKWAINNGITNGVDDGTRFGTKDGTTRAQVVTFLWRAAGCPEPSGDASKFTDVPAKEYYAKAVAWAIERGITTGTTETTFSPTKICTRAQIVTFLWRYAGSPVVDYYMNMTDVPSGEYYAQAVRWALAEKITTGTTETTFSPKADCIRAQVVTFLYRLIVK